MTSNAIQQVATDGLFPWGRYDFEPPAAYRLLQEESPVARVTIRNGNKPAWLVTRYDDVREVLADSRLSADLRNPGFPLLGPRFHMDNAGARRSLERMDGDEHRIFRKLLAPHFTARNIQAMRPEIQSIVDRYIDQIMAGDREFDLVKALALPVPSTVLSSLLGVHIEDHEFFNQAAEDVLNQDPTLDPSGISTAADALADYIARLLTERENQPDPGNDILGGLTKAVQSGRITKQEAINTGWLLIIAGHDTTASMAASGTLTLLRHPDQMEELRKDPSIIPAAVEEMLRYLTIAQLVILRVAVEDIEIGGVTIPAGEGVIPLNLAANRDHAHFPAADTFDIHRKPFDHVAFGYGVHQCLGQPLARLELQIIFETLLRRLPDLKLVDEDFAFKTWSNVSGLKNLRVSW